MQIDVQTKSRSLLGVSDLTVVAPIKRGLIPALDARSYASRARLLMRTLNTLRISSREAELTPLIADTVDQIRALHSFRLAIIEGPQGQSQILLAVTFDGGWEPYMRRIWRDLGPLLDVIFCNCEGYPVSVVNDFATYANWVRSSQVTTEFFYTASSLTVNDLHYLRSKEVERLAPAAGTAQSAGAGGAPSTSNGQDVFDQSLPALCAIYRLTDMYPPGTDDGRCLLRAADYLLSELSKALKAHPDAARWLRRQPLAASEDAALRWFRGAEWPPCKSLAGQALDASQVQGGILAPADHVTHACLLLLELKDAAAAVALLKHVQTLAVSEADQANLSVPALVNVFFTPQGLLACGVPQATLALMPFEFREGMAARAGILGDFLHNHPTNWRLPERNGPGFFERPGAAPSSERVELSCVHVLVQLSVRSPPATRHLTWDGAPNASRRHPLTPSIAAFANALQAKGVRILSIEPMQRYIRQGEDLPHGHFGYLDGISQPMPRPPKPRPWDQATLGDFLLGRVNSHGDVPQTGRLWDDSTFLVLRKLHQDVPAFNAALAQDPETAQEARTQLMGRDVSGVSPVTRKADNDFDYETVADAVCPFHSHMRRANPRVADPDKRRPLPRIIRRGMSYGPLPVADKSGAADRGLMFMAYNASIAEQFEVIQSWLSAGGSNGDKSFSGQRDAIVGVLNHGDPTGFEYTDASGKSRKLRMDPLHPFVKLEWGMYLFVPSIGALGELKAIAQEAEKLARDVPTELDAKKKEDARQLRIAIDAQKGAVAIGRLKQAEQLLGLEAAREQWKIALEDVSARMSGVSQWIWAAVRQMHGGVLRTPYGVLVCSREKVREVFDNRNGDYTATGYAERMTKSFGEIYLGMDDDAPVSKYRMEADATNAIIQSVDSRAAFEETRTRTQQALSTMAATERVVEVKDLVDAVLAALCEQWFDLPDGIDVLAGGWHWSDGRPTCPGHFHAPSRYMFQPNPGKEASAKGEEHGAKLNTAVSQWVARYRAAGTVPRGLLSRRIFDAIQGDDERLTRTIIGVLMGFLPTVDGNLRATLYEWVSDRSLWDHQIAYLAVAGTPHERACRVLLPPLVRTMQLRPVPELTWRIALRNHKLGTLDVRAGETVVISIVSAMQECLANDDMDIYAVFGGKRDSGGKTHTPTHACPGYEMARGVLLGFFAALVERAQLRPTLSPLALKMSLR